MFQVDVARGFVPVRLIGDLVRVPEAIPLVFCWQAQGFACFLRQPFTKRLGFETVDFYRPIPGHFDDLRHSAELIRGTVPDPEYRVSGP